MDIGDSRFAGNTKHEARGKPDVPRLRANIIPDSLPRQAGEGAKPFLRRRKQEIMGIKYVIPKRCVAVPKAG
jgi:hypothetical protein